MRVGISIDQMYRPQPGGIGTYVIGLIQGLSEIGLFESLALAPLGKPPVEVTNLGVPIRKIWMNQKILDHAWAFVDLGASKGLDVVHATSMAGPFPRKHIVRSVTVHDLLWRDEPESTTKSGIHYHERRLQKILDDSSLRIVVTSPGMKDRILQEGIRESRIHVAPLGADAKGRMGDDFDGCRKLLEQHGVKGSFTLSAGTLEPRKNIERLVEAHRLARRENNNLGPLVIVGPSGWSSVDVGDAVILGAVSRQILNALYKSAEIVAYVPRAEGWGLPPIEALHAGTRVVASTVVPSVEGNHEVDFAEFDDVADIARALLRAMERGSDPDARRQRTKSVEVLTWRACAAKHLELWT